MLRLLIFQPTTSSWWKCGQALGIGGGCGGFPSVLKPVSGEKRCFQGGWEEGGGVGDVGGRELTCWRGWAVFWGYPAVMGVLNDNPLHRHSPPQKNTHHHPSTHPSLMQDSRAPHSRGHDPSPPPAPTSPLPPRPPHPPPPTHSPTPPAPTSPLPPRCCLYRRDPCEQHGAAACRLQACGS